MSAVASSVRRKSFRFATHLDEVHDRSAVIHAGGKPDIVVNAPPEFKGEPGFWTPEDFFVASVEICLMLTIVGLAEKQGIAMVTYSSSAEGVLEWGDASYEFTRVVVRPSIVVSAPDETARIATVVSQAHRSCLIANSTRCPVLVEPSIAVVTTTVG